MLTLLMITVLQASLASRHGQRLLNKPVRTLDPERWAIGESIYRQLAQDRSPQFAERVTGILLATKGKDPLTNECLAQIAGSRALLNDYADEVSQQLEQQPSAALPRHELASNVSEFLPLPDAKQFSCTSRQVNRAQSLPIEAAQSWGHADLTKRYEAFQHALRHNDVRVLPWLQNLADTSIREWVLNEIIVPHFDGLTKTKFGNSLMVSFVTAGMVDDIGLYRMNSIDRHQKSLANEILMRGNFAQLAKDESGSRVITDWIGLSNEEKIANGLPTLTSEWSPGRVGQMIKIINTFKGCYVAQSLVRAYPSADTPVRDIQEAILHIGVRNVATNKHGSQVIERLIEHVSNNRIIAELLRSIDDLSVDVYGNFCVQKLFERLFEALRQATLQQRMTSLKQHKGNSGHDGLSTILESFGRNFVAMSQHWVGSQVLVNTIDFISMRASSLDGLSSRALGLMIGDADAKVGELEICTSPNSRPENVIAAIKDIAIPITQPPAATMRWVLQPINY